MLGSSKQIAELQGRAAALDAALVTANAEKAELQAALDAAQTNLSAAAQSAAAAFGKLKASLKGVRTKLAAVAGEDVTDEEEDPEKKKDDEEDMDARACLAIAEKLTSKASVDAEVTNRLAAAGADPVKRDPSAKAQGEPGAPVAGLTGIAKARAALIAAQSK